MPTLTITPDPVDRFPALVAAELADPRYEAPVVSPIEAWSYVDQALAEFRLEAWRDLDDTHAARHALVRLAAECDRAARRLYPHEHHPTEAADFAAFLRRSVNRPYHSGHEAHGAIAGVVAGMLAKSSHKSNADIAGELCFVAALARIACEDLELMPSRPPGAAVFAN